MDITHIAGRRCLFLQVDYFFISNLQYFSADLLPREAAKRKTNTIRSFFSWPFLTALEQRPVQEKLRLIDQLFRGYEEELVHNVNAAGKEVYHAHIWIQKIQVQWFEYSMEESGQKFANIFKSIFSKEFHPVVLLVFNRKLDCQLVSNIAVNGSLWTRR